MAGAIPPAHGGDRVFIDDPERATNTDAVGDLAAQFQAMMHVIGALPGMPAEAVALLGAIRERADVTRNAAEAISTRDRNQRNPVPLTNLPVDGGFGANAFGNSRITHITKFDGKSDDTNAVYVWLSSCLVVARAGHLTAEAILQMLEMTAGGSAFIFLEECRRKGMTLFKTVQALEMKYGELCTPDEAKTRAHSYQRAPGSSIDKVADDLKHLARLACREEEAAVREKRQDELVRHNLLRVLPSHIGLKFTDQLSQAVNYGGHLLSNDEIIAKAKLMESKLKGSQESSDRPKKDRSHDRHHHHARQVTHDSHPGYSEEDIDDILAVADAEEGGEEDIIDEILAVNEVFASRNQKVSMPALLSAAIKQHNKKRDFRPARVAGVSQPAPSGPPNKLGRFQAFSEMLKLANVVKGECMQCGLGGHIKGNIKCQLRGLPMVDRPCTRCGKGLHSADQCPKVNAGKANVVTEDDSLNED